MDPITGRPEDVADGDSPATAGGVRISIDLDPTVTFAMQQNDVPVVKALRISNPGAEPIRDLLVRIWSEPEFMAPWEKRIASIAPGSVHDLGLVDVDLSPGYLVGLTERVAGTIHVEVLTDRQTLACWSGPIEVLAYDEWSGLRSLPEILAAFVLPNHPAVEALLASAARILGGWTGDTSLSGYQSKSPERTFKIVAAVYSAMQSLQLSYVNPPASFEESGQKIRLADRILKNKLATCLDISVLAAACLEQAGLFPLVVILDGHAFPGAWLREECFADGASDDGLRLKKRVGLDEICVFEATLLTGKSPASFDEAVQSAKRRLEDAEKVRCVVDIQRCRKSRIRPLPVQVLGDHVVVVDEHAEKRARGAGVPSAPSLPTFSRAPDRGSGGASGEPADTPATRLDKWKRKLLDLSLNNRLIKFRESKKTLPILCPSLGSLEDALAKGKKFQLLERPAEMSDGRLRSDTLHLQRTGQDLAEELLKGEFQSGRLRTAVTRQELDRRLLEIYREWHTSLEEGGASTLFLALGFLAWYESGTSQQRLLAPIILIPIELERRSVQEGFRICLADEEPRINTTLMAMLARDFELRVPVADPIPLDESGVDVDGILTTFKEAIKDISRWDLVEDAQIGLFSFTKYLMWRDLQDRTDDLMKNIVVDHLVNRPAEAFPDSGAFPDPDRLDETYQPQDTFCPLGSDSSQLVAVYAAAEGKSFVLEGPPGTGKSQTITNLIAHSLAKYKTVLFVSEKMAALSVVHNRLKHIGLAPFCLELHSRKSNKTEVVRQLSEALDQIAEHSSGDWEREANRLSALRSELNSYVQSLHRKRETGESVFQATSRLIGLHSVKPVDLGWPLQSKVDLDRLEEMREILGQLSVAALASEHPSRSPWATADCQEWSPSLERGLQSTLTNLSASCRALRSAAGEVAPLIGLDKSNWSLSDYNFANELAHLLLAVPSGLPVDLILQPDWGTTRYLIEVWVEHGRKRDVLWADLHARYTKAILRLDLDGLRQRLASAHVSWFLPALLGRRFVARALRSVLKTGRLPSVPGMLCDLESAVALRAEEKTLSDASEEAGKLLGELWQEGETDWAAVGLSLAWCSSIYAVATRVPGSASQKATAFREHWATLLAGGREQFACEGRTGKILLRLIDAYEKYLQARRELEEKLTLDPEAAWGDPSTPDATTGISEQVGRWEANLPGLRTWSHWRQVRHRAMDNDLGPIVSAYEQGTVEPEAFIPTFNRSFYQWWVEKVTQSDPCLKGFFSAEFERKIEQFRQLDERYTRLAQETVKARLAARVPQKPAYGNADSEMAVLRHQFKLKRAHMPVRKLLQKIPFHLPRLKPCLLMSPISVAQYLDASHPAFDLVIFDEASQIPIWDAVGAIARGKTVVVVGDSKQLPPTNFFSRSDEEDEVEEDTVEDLESVLDDCTAAQLPSLQLRWHYRSRHESLIAFSNAKYYGNRLLTFPSPNRDAGVTLHPVPGTYDKGRTRSNRSEAEAVVAEILRRLLDPVLAKQSIGVVTFNMAQQALVEDLLEEARRAHPAIENFFSADAVEEPVFVKNLENVQGDERDAILFSICYGPDAQGRVSMNFGPLNRVGGERRLNVAITRARQQVIVFSTLKAEQIDLSRTRAEGVRDLKSFLDYASRGAVALTDASANQAGDDFELPFESAVCTALRDKGHEVHAQVGCSGYRIDLGVIDPRTPDRYLLGIECDGANYHRAKTARDRDRLRESVLRGLGWQLHRVWSADWWTNPAAELARIEALIEKAKNGDNVQPQKPMSPAKEPSVPTALARIASASPIAAVAPIQNGGPSQSSRFAVPPPLPSATTPRTPDTFPSASHGVYVAYRLERPNTVYKDFFDPACNDQIRDLVRMVVREEGPVSLPLVAKRVIPLWGLAKTTARVSERLRALASTSHVNIFARGEDSFLWPADVRPREYRAFRIPGGEDDSQRPARDIPSEEIANAAFHILEERTSLPYDDLLRETARLLGFQRTGQQVDHWIRAGLDRLFDDRRARDDNGRWVPVRENTHTG